MTDEFQQSNNNSHIDRSDVTVLPHQLRSWQTEVTSVLNDCLAELDDVTKMLGLIESNSSLTSADIQAAEPQPTGHAEGGFHSASTPRSGPLEVRSHEAGFAASGEQNDFDARLAKLKHMIAEKLADHDSVD